MTKLEQAEKWLRAGDNRDPLPMYGDERRALADELDRLRAELSALKGEAICPTGCGAPGEPGCCNADRCPDAPKVIQDLECYLSEQFPAEQGDVATVVKRLLTALKGEAECTRFAAGDTAIGCISDAFYATRAEADDARRYVGFSDVFALRLSARKVRP